MLSNSSVSIAARKAYDYLRGALSLDEDPYDYLNAYRHLARQISHDSQEGKSALIVTPHGSQPVVQSCALLSGSIAATLTKPVLLVDLSKNSRELANSLGLTSAMYCTTDWRSRFFAESGKWYIATREGIPVGPYQSVEEAGEALKDFIRAPNWVKDLKGTSWTPFDFVLPTGYQNLYFLPPAPARLAVSRGTFSGNADTNNRELLEELYRRFNFVIFYGGSLLEDSVVHSLIPHMDEVIHAVVENHTKVRDVDSAISILQTCGAMKIASILVKGSKEVTKILRASS